MTVDIDEFHKIAFSVVNRINLLMLLIFRRTGKFN